MKKTLKKIGCATLAVCSLAVGAFGLTSCTTDRPEVQMQLSFNGETYTLQYTLYRKYAPNTVNHFLTLVENGYYDGLCVHNYTDNDMYTGAYGYDVTSEAPGGLVYKPYFETVAAYGNFPVSVWQADNNMTPTYYLYGEFEENDFSVANGNFLRCSFGALTMYYTPKGDFFEQVKVKKVSDGKFVTKDYQYSSATSRFTISLKDRSYNKEYCTFATLNNTEVLEELVADIKAHTESAGTFTHGVTVEVDEDDAYVGDEGLTEYYNVPESPIVIEYVKVKKY